MAATVLVIGGVTHGWSSVPAVVPIPIVLAIALCARSGHDSDIGAMISHRLDERLVDERLRVQALVGRVLSVAVRSRSSPLGGGGDPEAVGDPARARRGFVRRRVVDARTAADLDAACGSALWPTGTPRRPRGLPER